MKLVPWMMENSSHSDLGFEIMLKRHLVQRFTTIKRRESKINEQVSGGFRIAMGLEEKSGKTSKAKRKMENLKNNLRSQ